MIYQGEVAGFYIDEKMKQQIGGGFFWDLFKETESQVLKFSVDRYWFEAEPPEGVLYFKLFGMRDELIDAVQGEIELSGDIQLHQLSSGLEGLITSYDYHEDAIHDRITFGSGTELTVNEKGELST